MHCSTKIAVALLNVAWVLFFLQPDPFSGWVSEVSVQKRSSHEEMVSEEFCTQPQFDINWTSTPHSVLTTSNQTNSTNTTTEGWSGSSFLPRQYHYVDDPMTWTEAQTYCRQKYTDLATVENTGETNQLKSSVPSDHHSGSVWIGLYSNITWKWSDGYTGTGSEYRNWRNIEYDEPNFLSGLDSCVATDSAGKWWDARCLSFRPFICYNGTQQDPDFILFFYKMNWCDAQRYCRENYIDLATVRNETENQKIQSLLHEEGWIGLYRDPDVFWSDGSGYSFQFWHQGSNPLGSMSVVCGAAYLPDSGKWKLRSCEDRFPFVCYSTGSKHVIKLRMKPDDPSVDLINTTV